MGALRGKNTEKANSTGSGLLNDESRKLNEKSTFDIQWLKLEQIQRNEKNKYHINDEEVQNMVVSIRRFGLRQNLEVRKIDDYHYVLITGEKRYLALKWLHENEGGTDTVPCLITNLEKIELPLSDEEKEILSINETNSTQRDYTEADLLYEIDSLDGIYSKLRQAGIEDFEGRRIKGAKNRELIARQLGLSTGTVQKYQRVSKNASEDLKEEISQGNVTVNVAEKIVSLPAEQQNELIKEVKESGRTTIEQHDFEKYNAVQEEIKATKNSKKKKSAPPGEHKYKLNGEEYLDEPGEYTLTKSEFMKDIKAIMNLLNEGGCKLDEKKYFQYKKQVKILEKMLQ